MPATMDLETENDVRDHRRSAFVRALEGGGNTPPVVGLVRRLVERGHQVRILGDPCNRAEFEGVGASFVSWKRANPRHDKSRRAIRIKDWEVKSPPAMLGLLRDRVFVGPALNHAQDLLDALREFPADVVATSEMLLGVMAAAESAGVPCVAVAANICLYPLPGVPPFGPGFAPMGGLLGRLRDGFVRGMTMREFGRERRVSMRLGVRWAWVPSRIAWIRNKDSPNTWC